MLKDDMIEIQRQYIAMRNKSKQPQEDVQSFESVVIGHDDRVRFEDIDGKNCLIIKSKV